MNARTKLFSILLAGLMMFGMVGSVSAANTASVSTSATIPGVLGISVDKTSLTYNLASTGSYINADQGDLQVTNNGNIPTNIMAKLSAAPNANLLYMFDSTVLSTTDQNAKASAAAGSVSAMPLKIKAIANMPAGTFNNTMVLTAVAV